MLSQNCLTVIAAALVALGPCGGPWPLGSTSLPASTTDGDAVLAVQAEVALVDGLHPAALAMVPCWLSDMRSPVVTEINLDAVAANRNQFGETKRDGEWLRASGQDGGDGFVRYRVKEGSGPRWTLELEDRGGGSLTSRWLIDVEVADRAIEVDGCSVRTRVLRVLGVRDVTARSGAAG